MYIFDGVVAVGFHTLYYGAERCRGTSGMKPSHESVLERIIFHIAFTKLYGYLAVNVSYG